MKITNKFYTYVHMRNDDGSIFYVGKGSGHRAWLKRQRNRLWSAITNKHGHTVHICGIFDTEEEALNHEVMLIDLHTRNGAKLANIRPGGTGGRVGKIGPHSPEHAEKIVKARLAYFEQQRINTGKAQTISESHQKALHVGYESHVANLQTKTGVRNVKLHRGRYEVRIKRQGKEIFGGSYTSIDEATKAAQNLRDRYQGRFV